MCGPKLSRRSKRFGSLTYLVREVPKTYDIAMLSIWLAEGLERTQCLIGECAGRKVLSGSAASYFRGSSESIAVRFWR